MKIRSITWGGVISLFTVSALLFAAPAKAQNDAASLYKSKCSICHGAEGKGDTPVGKKLGVRDFASPEVQKETDKELIEITINGKNKMPAYGKSLTAAQIKALVAYIRDLAKKR